MNDSEKGTTSDRTRLSVDYEILSERAGQLRVAILDDYQGFGLQYLEANGPQADYVSFRRHINNTCRLLECLKSFQVVVVMRERTAITSEIINALPKLELIVSTGPSNAAIDIAAARKNRVTVCGTRIDSSPTIELTWLHILSLSRNVIEQNQTIRDGTWQGGLGVGLAGKTIGLVGLGKIGSRVGEIALSFGMRAIAWSENLDKRAPLDRIDVVNKDDLFEVSDFVTIHLRLSERTQHTVCRRELLLMKASAYLINTSRAGLVDTSALIEMLHSGEIAGAALDVFDNEPVQPHDPILGAPNTVLTPHIGYVTREQYRLFYADVASAVSAHISGRPIQNLL